jgi:16S rRNA (guanine527-N7)-methyltransferase
MTVKERNYNYLSDQNAFDSLLKTGAEELDIVLSDGQLKLFALYWRELQEWNRVTNITAINSLKDTIIKHFLDSLSVIENLPGSGHLADIGSGGGFPGVPIAIVRPDMRVILIEAARKKANFLRQVVRVLGLKSAEVYHGRAEALATAGRFNCIVSRAFSSMETFLKISAPLLTEEGIIIAMKGKSIEQELREAEQEIRAARLVIAEQRHFLLPFHGGTRTIVVFKRNVSRETLA